MTTVLPEHVLKLLSPEDRAKLGKAGLTADEARAQWQAKDEKDLQRNIVNMLRLKGIEVISSRTDRRTTQKRGVPDLIFSIRGFACAFEVKVPNGRISQEQAAMLQKLTTPPNSWQVAVVRSLDDAIAFLKTFELL